MRHHLMFCSAMLCSLLAAPVSADDVLLQKNISLALARDAAEAALQNCSGKGWKVSVAIVDRAGQLKMQLRGDGAGPRIENDVTNGRGNGPDRQGLGWGYQILPHLEQNAVYNLVTTPQIKETIVPLYNCPSRRAPTTSQEFNGIPGPTVVLSDYAGATPCTCKTAACDTFFVSDRHTQDRSHVAGVGACKVTGCRHNTDLECAAAGIRVSIHDNHADCMTFAPR